MFQDLGAGELFVNSIDRDGTYRGYDIELIKLITAKVEIPVIACGGAASVKDFQTVIYQGGASAAAAGSMFVFQGQNRGVLTNFPSKEELRDIS